MYKCLIVEGVDGAGKSRLISPLNYNRFAIRHSGGPSKNQTEFLSRCVAVNDHIRDCTERIPVFDRVPMISEQIYGPILRRHRWFDDCLLTRMLLEVQPIIIWMHPSFDIIEERSKTQLEKIHKPKKHIDLVLKNLEKIYVKYELLMDELMTDIPVLKFDETNSSADIARISTCVG